MYKILLSGGAGIIAVSLRRIIISNEKGNKLIEERLKFPSPYGESSFPIFGEFDSYQEINRVSVSLRRIIISNQKPHLCMQMILNVSVSLQRIIISNDKPLKQKDYIKLVFPSPCGESSFPMNMTDGTYRNFKAFPSPCGESSFPIQ